MKILFVENHSAFAETVSKVFLADHKITLVSTVSQAWASVSESRFDVILVDYDLNDGKGDTLIKKVRQDNLQVKIIGVSAHEYGNMALNKAGADKICSKLNFRHINEAIQSVLNS